MLCVMQYLKHMLVENVRKFSPEKIPLSNSVFAHIGKTMASFNTHIQFISSRNRKHRMNLYVRNWSIKSTQPKIYFDV